METDRIRRINSVGNMTRFKIVMQRSVLEVDESTEPEEKICTNDTFLYISGKEGKCKFRPKSKVFCKGLLTVSVDFVLCAA